MDDILRDTHFSFSFEASTERKSSPVDSENKQRKARPNNFSFRKAGAGR